MQAESVTQLDSGEPGRGSCLRAQRGGSYRDFLVTYWEPPTAVTFYRRQWGLAISYRFRHQERAPSAAVTVAVVNESSGLWRIPAALLAMLERRRLAALTR